jgi:multiple antibiotic resistance protein
VAFILSNIIVKKLGHNLIAVVAKLMGLILAIIGADMLIEGVKLSFNL